MVNLFHVNNRDDGFVDFVRARHRNPLRWFPYNNIKISSFKIFPLIWTVSVRVQELYFPYIQVY